MHTLFCFRITHDDESLIFENTGSNSLDGNIPTELGNLINLTNLYFGKYISDLYYLFVLDYVTQGIVSSHYLIMPQYFQI